MGVETERKIRLWILGGATGVLLTIVGWGAIHLIDSIESGVSSLSVEVKEMNATMVGFMAAQIVRNEYTDKEIKQVKDDVIGLKQKIESFRLAGKAIIEANPRGSDKTPYENLKEKIEKDKIP